MAEHELAFLATNDLCAITRGRAMPLARLDPEIGCGWVPANLGVGAFGTIVEGSPFDATGDLRLVPDRRSATRIDGIPGRPPLTVMLADITQTDGGEWECCPRTFLRRAVRELEEEAGLRVFGAFEHEFMLAGDAPAEPPMSLQAMLRTEPLGTELVGILAGAGLQPENWLAEYGVHQCEITVAAADALTAADRAVLLRDIVRNLAHARGQQATFAPLLDPEAVGNGVHVHFSLRDTADQPVTFDAGRPGRLSAVAGSFAAGIVRHARALLAFTAASEVSYLRLAPHRWSATHAFLGRHNREAMLRLCPTVEIGGRDPADQLNLEFRAGDATGNPWLVMGLLIRAGLEGLRAKLEPPALVDGPIEAMPAKELRRAGILRLPATLAEALAALEEDKTVTGWFSPELLQVYRALKQDELRRLEGLDDAAKCLRYAGVY
ncbi:glutamine synthetase family protein [Arthrobacter sp. USHLN218]|uniref:glutamine synthetase family protein n=1 Tax=Arthrobacter sp. USHLN218 TaxID=3081232 RepID=UPI00301A6A74